MVRGLILSCVFILSISPVARSEELIIENPGEHPHYFLEAEPHALIRFGQSQSSKYGSGLGIGFRGTFNLLENGFVRRINNNVGLGVGLDYLPDADRYIFIPIVMHWNFWLSTHWSLFGEPGIHLAVGDGTFADWLLQVGGRYHFNDHITLVLRFGYPAFSIGVSFF
ncbi:hypothetical protein BCY86_04870 [Pajaroellobacter abortibovis]|uniref:Outer membrane protein beta-barrel domain-containing protein n=1 Tax=Pajaroellobacter abortibovis TaxID=1882918 RepID=A0A1L6MXC6_9BACT|nr:hypothetical protein BCY86_04870 [Pajaroellobacter abortibovis]